MDNATRVEVEDCKWLYLWKICEQQGGSELRIEIGANRGARDDYFFEVTWSRYISYQIGGESYQVDRKGDVFDGAKFRCHTKSAYLTYVRSTPSTEVLGVDHADGWTRVRHWALYCLDHTIDVVSSVEPQIRLLDPPASWLEDKKIRAELKQTFEENLARNREQSILSTIEERARRERRG